MLTAGSRRHADHATNTSHTTRATQDKLRNSRETQGYRLAVVAYATVHLHRCQPRCILSICCGLLARHNLTPSVIGYADGCGDLARGGRSATRASDAPRPTVIGAPGAPSGPRDRQRFVEETRRCRGDGPVPRAAGRSRSRLPRLGRSACRRRNCSIVGVDVERGAALIYADRRGIPVTQDLSMASTHLAPIT